MKNIKTLITLVFILLLSACSSTEKMNTEQVATNTSSNKYASTTNFPHSSFTATNSETIKKPLETDHQLMMSLLNRPMTEDQKMMLAFAQQRAQTTAYLQQSGYADYTFSNYVTITGNKEETPLTKQPINIYSKLIANDINAVEVTGSL